MVLVHKFGKPDLFITMTCNELWEEIVNNIGVNEKVIDRRLKLFNQKVKELNNEIVNKCIFCKCMAFTYAIKLQERHILIFIDAEDKLHNANEVNKNIGSEIPDNVNNPRLYKIVKNLWYMVHVVNGTSILLAWMI